MGEPLFGLSKVSSAEQEAFISPIIIPLNRLSQQARVSFRPFNICVNCLFQSFQSGGEVVAFP